MANYKQTVIYFIPNSFHQAVNGTKRHIQYYGLCGFEGLLDLLILILLWKHNTNLLFTIIYIIITFLYVNIYS